MPTDDHYHIHTLIEISLSLSFGLGFQVKSHHQRELKAAEEGLSKAKKAAESIVGEAKANYQEMQALQLELEELAKAFETQQQQVWELNVPYFLEILLYLKTALEMLPHISANWSQ